jgi:hypothetical protein
MFLHNEPGYSVSTARSLGNLAVKYLTHNIINTVGNTPKEKKKLNASHVSRGA